MIKKITIADIATYSHEPSMMESLTKINFVYGTNGSGKTTISNYLSNYTKYNGSCSIEWDNNIPIKVYTYNKAFRESHFWKTYLEYLLWVKLRMKRKSL